MHASFGYSKKIYLWLIIVFSCSGLIILEITSNDHPEQRTIQRIFTKTDTLKKPLQLSLINRFGINRLVSKPWNPKFSYQNLKSNPALLQRDSTADRLAFNAKMMSCWKPKRTNFKFHCTIKENDRIKDQNSVVTKAVYKQESLGTAQLPRQSILRGNGFMAFLLAGSLRFLFARNKIKKWQSKLINNQKAKAPKLSTPEGSQNKNTTPPITKATQESGQTVPPEVVKDIWHQLDDFEKEKGYLDKELNLIKLSARLKTNHRYLSHVINKHKKMSFTTYLKTLRITNAKNRLLKEPKLMRFNQKGLADEFGFKSGRTFSLAFTKHTGKRLSKLLEELNNK